MGDRRQAAKPFQYVTSYPSLLSLAMHSEYRRKMGQKQAHRAMH